MKNMEKLFSKKWILTLFTATFALAIFWAMSITTFAAVGDVTNISLQDTDDNGKIETVIVTIDDTGDAGGWTQASSPAVGLIIKQGGVTKTISATAVTDGTSVAYLTATLDESEMALSTDGVTENPVEVVYTQGGIGVGVDNGAVQMETIVIGDSGQGDSEVDEADPVLTAVVLSTKSGRNRLTFTYTEIMDITGGASTATKGDTSVAGTVAGFGSFAVTGDVTVPTTLNTVGGIGTDDITIDLADQSIGYMDATSTTEPSGVFTQIASGVLLDAAGNSVNAAAASPTASGGGSWDLGQPSVSTITVYDAVGNNGKIDQAIIVFDEAVRDANITDADADLATGGTTTGTFTTGTANDETTTFNRAADDATTGTAYTDGDFTYDGSTTPITDLAGNLLNGDGQIASGDVTETDGAKPILVSAVFNTSSNKNNLTLTYSEVLSIYTGGDGATGQIAAASNAASTATLGAMTTPKTVAGIVSWDGLSDFDCSAATVNNVALDATGKIITVTFNNVSGSYFVAGSTAPLAGDTLTPEVDANDLEDAVGLPANVSHTINPTVTAWDATAPTQMSGFTYDSIGGDVQSVNFSWTAHTTLADFNRYMLARADTAGAGLTDTLWTISDDSNLATRTDTDTTMTGLTANSTYYVTMYAIDIAGNVSTAATEVSVLVSGSDTVGDSTAPSTPTNFAASVNEDMEIVLTWTDPSASDLNNIQIVRSKGEDVDPSSVLTNISKGLQTYTDSDIEEGEVVNYKIKAKDVYGNASNYTSILTITVEPGAVIDVQGPGAPGDFTVEVDENLYAILTWVDPTDEDLTNVKVYKSTDGETYEELATVDPEVQTYTDESVTAGETVYYKLAAVDTYDNEGTRTNAAEITIETGATAITGPDAPTDFAAELNEDMHVVLTWADPTVDNLSGVKVYKSADGETYEELATVEPGVQTYTDESVVEGDTVSYKLAGIDSDDTLGEEVEIKNFKVEEEEPEVPSEVSFSDVGDHWAMAEIGAMAERGIVSGDPDGSFRPDDNLNRAEAGALLYRVLGLEEPSAPENAPFSDVEVDAWYAGYINDLKEMGLVNGNPDGTYRPGNNINRAEFLILGMNVYYYLADEDAKAEFDALKDGELTDMYVDLDEDAWYAPIISVATELGFVHGSECEGGRCFNAANNISRAEATVMLYNIFADYLAVE